MSPVPFTRTLPYVLRDRLAGKGLAMRVAEVAAVPDPTHVTITQAGVETVIPRISSYAPTVGEPAVCFAADTLMLAVGAVGGITGGGGGGTQGPQGPAGPQGPPGPQGPAGPQGATGATGAQGATGATGPAGPQGSQGPQGPSGSTALGLLVAHQSLAGQNESYSGNITSLFEPVGDGSKFLQFHYTPTANVLAQVTLGLGLVSKVDAAYSMAYGAVHITPSDMDGVAYAYEALVQHAQVDNYAGRMISRDFRLAANTAYTINSVFSPQGTGTWQIYQGAGHLWMSLKAWTV